MLIVCKKPLNCSSTRAFPVNTDITASDRTPHVIPTRVTRVMVQTFTIRVEYFLGRLRSCKLVYGEIVVFHFAARICLVGYLKDIILCTYRKHYCRYVSQQSACIPIAVYTTRTLGATVKHIISDGASQNYRNE